MRLVGETVWKGSPDAAASEAVEKDVIYNMAGQRVGADYKGVVIKNGKKYLNK